VDAKLRLARAAPQVIVPAYGCPDLIAACLFAGTRAVLVDTPSGAWGYDLDGLRAACTANTVAIVAMNLLGVGDQAAELYAVARASGCLLIQDSAQYLPPATTHPWRGDYVALSFGRGKPLNLLRGGALLLPQERSEAANFSARAVDCSVRVREALLSTRAAGVAFNLCTLPIAYRLTSILPGLGVGATNYRMLSSVSELPVSAWKQLSAALIGYGKRPEYSTLPWQPFLAGWEKAGISPLACAGSHADTDGQRLRFPLLARDLIQRDAIVAALNREGLGPSCMYGTTMNKIAHIPEEVAMQGPFHNATLLAKRLLTLPTHSLVNEQTAARTDRIIRQAAGSMHV
jgi:dTDP-4-amino-4,6-dideoxygalactose transaminase